MQNVKIGHRGYLFMTDSWLERCHQASCQTFPFSSEKMQAHIYPDFFTCNNAKWHKPTCINSGNLPIKFWHWVPFWSPPWFPFQECIGRGSWTCTFWLIRDILCIPLGNKNVQFTYTWFSHSQLQWLSQMMALGILPHVTLQMKLMCFQPSSCGYNHKRYSATII